MLRCNVASDFEEVVCTARLAFSKRSWPYLLAMAVPWILCAGQRSLKRMAAMGGLRRSTSAYYRFLSEGKWRQPVLTRALFDLIVKTFKLAELTLVVDDTLCPKWGRHIFGTGTFFDHTARPRPGFVWGHNWVVMAIVVRSKAGSSVALPFWIKLYRSKKDCVNELFLTRLEMTSTMLEIVRAWFSGPIRLLADGAYANRTLAVPARCLRITLISRLRSDARLRAPAPARRPTSMRGRKPKHGKSLPKLRALSATRSAFRELTVSIYGHRVRLLVREFIGYWPAIDSLIKVVITRDPKRPKRVAYLVSTDIDLQAQSVIEGFAQRWSIEQLFSVAKCQMGLDTSEVRKRTSVVRHAALCMALITWTEVWAYRRFKDQWWRSFNHKLAELRSATIAQSIFASGPRHKRSRRNAANIADLFTQATRAA